MRWVIVAAIVAAFGGMLVLATPPTVTAMRERIRKFFSVTNDCQITYTGDPAKAGTFWTQFDPYLREMIKLARSIGVTDSAGVAAYTSLNLFPECDLNKQSNSLKLTLAAMEFRIAHLMESGQ